jgi:hypothetical protein
MLKQLNTRDRGSSIAGSDARVITGEDEANLVHLWREKRREAQTRRSVRLPDCPPRHLPKN